MISNNLLDSIKHENELINHRLNWLGVFQGFLFAALALGLNNSMTGIVYITCGLGFFVAISVGVSTFKANDAINTYENEAKKLDPQCGIYLTNQSGCFWWLMPGYSIPPAFAISWLIIFLIKIFGCAF